MFTLSVARGGYDSELQCDAEDSFCHCFGCDAGGAIDKFHVIAHASEAMDKMHRIEQYFDPSRQGLRRALLRDRSKRAVMIAGNARILPHRPLRRRVPRSCSIGPVS